MKKLLLVSLLGSCLFAKYNGMLLTDELGEVVEPIKSQSLYTHSTKTAFYNVLPYYGKLSYSGSTTKDSGTIFGIYFSDFKTPWKTELSITDTSIKYTNTTSNLTQLDIAILLNYYKGYNDLYKFGFHYINSSDSTTNKGKIFSFEKLYYQTLKYNYGVDIYYSYYSNNSTSPTILQFSPKGGYSFGNYYSNIGSFYIEAIVDYIKPLTQKTQNNLKNSYLSTSFTLNNYKGKFTTSLNIWFGKRSFEVSNNGFVVNNLSNKQTGGFTISENYKIDKKSSIKLSYSKTNFEENGKSNSKTILANYSYSF